MLEPEKTWKIFREQSRERTERRRCVAEKEDHIDVNKRIEEGLPDLNILRIGKKIIALF